MNRESAIIAVDIGKTKISCAIFSKSGNCIQRNQFHSADNARGILDITEAAIREMLLVNNDVAVIVLAAFGVIDSQSGVVIKSGVIPDWNDIHLKSYFEQLFSISVMVENDVKAAAFGEYYSRYHHNAASMLYLSLGTNIGFSYILNGEIIRGSANKFGEICMFPAHNNYVLGEIIGGNGISKQYFDKTGKKLSTFEIYERAKANDIIANHIFNQMISTLVNLLKWFSYCFDPNTIVLGGGMICNNHDLFSLVQEKYNPNGSISVNQIDIATYKEDSGLYGSYFLGMKYTET